MNSFVKNLFTLLLWLTLAWVAYLILFGTYSLSGINLADGTTPYTGAVAQSAPNRWKGLIYHAALAIEHPIARYYYEYCYLPNIHASDYVDEALGGVVNNSTYHGGDLFETITDLRYDSDMYTFTGGFSTGWR